MISPRPLYRGMVNQLRVFQNSRASNRVVELFVVLLPSIVTSKFLVVVCYRVVHRSIQASLISIARDPAQAEDDSISNFCRISRKLV